MAGEIYVGDFGKLIAIHQYFTYVCTFLPTYGTELQKNWCVQYIAHALVSALALNCVCIIKFNVLCMSIVLECLCGITCGDHGN